ncbi:MAG: hypothetical protein HY841_04220 [Bacteroidetes bacterium]|nr:hypothetical protein [Bacteroidota bacterium]
MMRITYILAIVVSLFFGVLILDYIVRVNAARSEQLYEMMNSYSSGSEDSYNSYNSYDDERDNRLTSEAGMMSLFFFLFFLALGILTLIKLKTKTMKIISIIGLALTVIMSAWNAVMMGSPGAISFDEVGIVWVLYAVVLLTFSIIGTIHAFKKKA